MVRSEVRRAVEKMAERFTLDEVLDEVLADAKRRGVACELDRKSVRQQLDGWVTEGGIGRRGGMYTRTPGGASAPEPSEVETAPKSEAVEPAEFARPLVFPAAGSVRRALIDRLAAGPAVRSDLRALAASESTLSTSLHWLMESGWAERAPGDGVRIYQLTETAQRALAPEVDVEPVDDPAPAAAAGELVEDLEPVIDVELVEDLTPVIDVELVEDLTPVIDVELVEDDAPAAAAGELVDDQAPAAAEDQSAAEDGAVDDLNPDWIDDKYGDTRLPCFDDLDDDTGGSPAPLSPADAARVQADWDASRTIPHELRRDPVEDVLEQLIALREGADVEVTRAATALGRARNRRDSIVAAIRALAAA